MPSRPLQPRVLRSGVCEPTSHNNGGCALAWERRKRGGLYYTRTRRVGGRVRREYVGGGVAGVLADALDTQARARRELERHRLRAFREARTSDDADRERLFARVETVVRAALLVLGFHYHKRGEWRRRRMSTTRTVSWLLSLPSGPVTESRINRIEELFGLANEGGSAALAELRSLFSVEAFEEIGDLARQVRYNLVQNAASGCKATAATIQAKADRLTSELQGPAPTPLERLLAERVTIAWLALHRIDLEAAACEGTFSGPLDSSAAMQSERLYHAKRQESAQRRYLQAIRTLAQVRRLLGPAFLQLNLGGQHLHVARASARGEGSRP